MSQTYYSSEVSKTTTAWNYLTSAQVKNYLKQEANVTAEDTLITALNEAAQSQFEQFTNKALTNGSISVRYFEIYTEGTYIEVTMPLLGTYSNLSISTKYENTTTTLTENTDYYVNQNRVRINRTSIDGVLGEIEIILTADLVATFDDPNVEPALYKMIADMYNYRGNEVIGQNVMPLTGTTQMLLMPFKDVNTLI